MAQRKKKILRERELIPSLLGSEYSVCFLLAVSLNSFVMYLLVTTYTGLSRVNVNLNIWIICTTNASCIML